MENKPFTLADLTELEMPSVIMMAGVPGSGKSYIAEQLSTMLEHPVLSADAIREELTGNQLDNSINTEAWHILHDRAATLIADQYSVIIDATHAEQQLRRDEISLYRSMGARAVVCVEIQTPYDTLIARNQSRDKFVPIHAIDRIRRNLRQYPPSTEDGFDGVARIAN